LKNNEDTLKVLLDTSFILPTLGVDTGVEVRETLKKLNEIKVEIYYSSFSILESIWVIIRLMRESRFNIERFRLGLRSLIESHRYKCVVEDSEVFIQALNLYTLGHKDLIDNILYVDSLHFNLKLLTLDEELIRFVQDNKLKNTILTPNQI